MTEHHETGSVRITNVQIFDELRLTRSDVASLKQSVDESLKPGLSEVRADVRNLTENKAEKADIAKLEGAINSVRVQAWGIGTGVVAGLLALRTLGVI